MKALLPDNEAQRLKTLRGYDVLDTPPEPDYDDLTLLAAQICQTPTALVSLIDENRQWFKSKVGLSVTGTPRDFSFCAHAILNSDKVLEVRDALLDPRFADNPLVIDDPHIRFYAGAPLLAADGLALGTLSVIDYQPRELNEIQKNSLLALSRHVVTLLQLRRSVNELRQADAALRVSEECLEHKVEVRTAELQREIEVRKRVEVDVRERERRLQTIIETEPECVKVVDPKGNLLEMNAAGLAMLEAASLGEAQQHSLLGFILPEHRNAFRALHTRVLQGERGTLEFEVLGLKGTRRWLETHAAPMRDVADKVVGLLGITRDITERKQAEAQLKLAAKVFEQSSEAFLVSDANNNIVMVNHAFTVITGYGEAEALGQNPRMLSSGQQDQGFYRAMWEAINTHGHWQGELVDRHKDGSLYPKWLSISRLLDAQGKVTHYICIFNDISQRKQYEERIEWLAHFDALTGLPNRILLNDRISQALGRAHRSHTQLAVLFLDLDHFKNVNDNLGHRIGDELLMETARRLKSVVRDEDTVSRLGGDEFILLLPGTDADGAAHAARKLLDTTAQSFQSGAHELFVTSSIGIAMYPNDGEDFETLSRCADVAMYRAKHEGRNGYRFFTAEMQERSARNLQLETALRHALERDQFRLHYQPQMLAEGDRIIGVEALLRWQHPELGAIAPAEFIPIAEDSGQIMQIGEWVLRKAASQMKSWIDSGMQPMIMAINLSAVQFRHPNLPNLPGLITQILDEVQLPPQYLELELTEGVAMDDPLGAIAVMGNLHERGIRMSIDDFGTGYSSLNYLKRFQVYKLKIDQSFVRDITEDTEDRAIITAIIRLADALGLQTIAEGVETEAQLAFLRKQGCNEMQGYYFCKPLPADQLEAFVREKTRVEG